MFGQDQWNRYIYYLIENIDGLISKFADYTKIAGIAGVKKTDK